MSEPSEFSEAVIHDRGDRVELEWQQRGFLRITLVADEVVEQWAAGENERRALRARLDAAENVCRATETLLEWAQYADITIDGEWGVGDYEEASEISPARSALAAWRLLAEEER